MIDIYDAIKERENQVSILQAQISALQADIKALRIAARILEGGGGAAKTSEDVSTSASVGVGASEKTRLWP